MSHRRSKFVRSSQFRHIFGEKRKKEQCYNNIPIPRQSHEGKFCAANEKFVAVCVYSGGGGSFLVIPLEQVGRQDINAPKVTGHKSDVLDLAWNPFNDHMIASGDEDGLIKIWEIPEGGLTSNLSDALLAIRHQKKCTQVSWHPSASSILMSVSDVPEVVVWNLESAERLSQLNHPDMIYNADWNENGSKILTSCKDKTFRVFDARSGSILQTFSGHSDGKPQRAIFIDEDKVFSTGFANYSIWDLKDTKSPVMEGFTGHVNGNLIPYLDRDINILYLTGRGNRAIRYYELVKTEPYIYLIGDYQTTCPHLSVCLSTKKACDLKRNEVARFYRVLSKQKRIEPVSFVITRKTNLYDSKIFPDTASDSPALTADEWVSGKNSGPLKESLEPYFREGAPLKAKKAATALELKIGSKAASRSAGGGDRGGSVDDAKVRTDDAKVVELKKEIKDLMQKEMAALREELTEVKKIKLEVSNLREAIQKNDKRVTVLESHAL